MKCMFPILVLCAAAVADDGARLQALLDAYGRSGGGDTMAIEKEILRLRDEGAAGALVRHAGHARFGPIAVWALGSLDSAGEAERIVAAVRTWPRMQQVHAAVQVAAIRAPAVRAWLAELPADEGTVRAARLRADVAAEAEAVEVALASDDADAVARALLLAGNARATDFLAKAAALAGDARALKEPVPSAFAVQETEDLGNGRTRTTTKYPELRTLGEVAVEAASRMAAPATPETIAWWYELEKGPRFQPNDDGRRLLTAYAKAARDAAAAAAPDPDRAFDRLVRRLREEGVRELVLLGIEWKGNAYRIEHAADGGTRTAVIDASLRVSGD